MPYSERTLVPLSALILYQREPVTVVRQVDRQLPPETVATIVAFVPSRTLEVRVALVVALERMITPSQFVQRVAVVGVDVTAIDVALKRPVAA